MNTQVLIVGAGPVTLIRPDGYVAYTAHGRGPVAALDSVRTLLERQTDPESDRLPICAS